MQKQVAMKFIHVVEKKKIKIMLLDSLYKSILITRGRKASSPTYFLYEELSHREKQPSSIKKYKINMRFNKISLNFINCMYCYVTQLLRKCK